MERVPLRLFLDPESPISTYRQVTDGLRALLVNGSFEPGQHLPTVRELALELGVHHNTVANAYRVLAKEGWLDLARRRGAIVRDRAVPAGPSEKAEQQWVRQLSELIARGLSTGISPQAVTAAMTAIISSIGVAPHRSEKR